MAGVQQAMPASAMSRDGEEDEKENFGDEEGRAKRSILSTPLCQECSENPAKYKCPGCGIRSCGVACVKAHKLRTSCTGKRDRSAFVPLALYDENWLISDYNLLEETLRQADSAKRMRIPFGGIRQELNGRWTALRNQARNRNITLLFLPQGMTRRIENSSLYCRKRRCILWRVEWVFHSTEVRLVDICVDENLRLVNMLEDQLVASPGNAVTRHQLRHFCKEPVECLSFLLVKEPCSGEERRFVELNPTEPLGSQLANMIIIEYPVIHVVLPACKSNLAIVEDLRCIETKTSDVAWEEQPVGQELNEPEGIPYREEEIEEGEIVD